VRIAVVFYALEPTGGGAHTFAGSLLEALRAAEPASRHEFVLYSTATARPIPGVRQIPFTRRERYRRRAIYALRDALDRHSVLRPPLRTWFERSLAEERIDLVWFASNYAEDCDLPFVFTVLDVEHLRQPWFPEVGPGGEWERRHAYFSRYIPKATRIVVPNVAGAEQVERAWRVERDRILCLTHPTPDFALRGGEGPAPALPERFGLRPPYLLYPAQFWAHKDHATVLEALAELPGYELALVGSDKGQQGRVRALADELGVAERTRFLGFVEQDELVALYRNAHALAYASRFGPENLPPLEAFALGCPAIVADVPGAEHQVGDAGLRFAIGDAGALAGAVRRLEDERLRAELVERGRARARASSAAAYVRGVLDFADEFERTRRLWT
jgi:glycosyltransferase involved in cell wall biosynthesis